MHGLADIRAINNAVLNDEVARRKRLAKKASDDTELAEATEYVKRLRSMNVERFRTGDQFDEGDINAIADLLVSAYGIQED